ncbi:hypothetical protein [Mesorhizobium australicum]|uniref:hypothetical protein n=1 Tax=Mesorhizobium australicum TaxID=536018 RepID=UPI0033389F36
MLFNMSGYTLPEIAWRLDTIEAHETERAADLALPMSPDELIDTVVAVLIDSVESGVARFGWDRSSKNELDYRAVLQFEVGNKLFDRFFNAVGGYRAQYRMGWEHGLHFNERLVVSLVEALKLRLPSKISVVALDSEFRPLRVDSIESSEFLFSLGGAPLLSKLWFCGKLLEPGGTVSELIPSLTGPKIQLDGDTRWPSIESSNGGAWLDMKGAFLGNDGLYQPKSAEDRARRLSQFGDA